MTLIIEIKVVPSAGKQVIKLDKTQKLKCYLKSPPEKGKANKELIKLLSKKLNIPQLDISIIKGATSRNKTILIKTNDNIDTVLSKLGIEQQLTIQ